MRVIVVTGDPGAGKSTAIRVLAGALAAPVWSAGRVARELAPDRIGEGDWGPEEALTDSLMQFLRQAQEAGAGFAILDGWPRKLHQAYELPGRLAVVGASWHSAIVMKISREAALRRYRCFGLIRVCSKCGTPAPLETQGVCPLCGGTSFKDLVTWYNERRDRQEAALASTIGALEQLAAWGSIGELTVIEQE